MNRDYQSNYRCRILTALLFTALLTGSQRIVFASTVSNLEGFYSHGQVFLTWVKTADQSAYYKVYRSTLPVTQGSQLSGIEYLGYTNSSSSLDFDLTKHDGVERYFVIVPDFEPMNSNEGLFVATTLSDGAYYYAVTAVINGTEDLTIVAGENALLNPVAEMVAPPQPVYQQTRTAGAKQIEIYTTFISSKYAAGQPLMNQAGFIANDFALYRNGATSQPRPLRIRFHGGGGDFLLNITTVQGDEMNINPEHFLPGGKHAFWWGAHEHFNIFDADSNLTAPASGMNFDFSQQQISRLMDWAIEHLPVDTNRIYLEGSSMGSIGAYFYAINNPERIAAVKLSGSVFDLSFQDDFYPGCMLNEGNSYRVDGDRQFGAVGSGLLSNSGLPFYDQMNGNWMISTFMEKDYPLIYSINGKNDTVVGWTEKTVYYQTLNTSHIGGYYFWDRRKHGGGSLATWSDENFNLLRYRNNRSFPAFANCSVNEDYGNGSAVSGADYGSVNGFLDWKDNIVDEISLWQAEIFLRDLKKLNGSLESAPTSCTVDVTPRRLQQFALATGDEVSWSVEHNSNVIQSGSLLYQGGIITIPDVIVFQDTVRFSLWKETPSDTTIKDISDFTIFPNVFQYNTSIEFYLPVSGRSTIAAYDLQGRLLQVLLSEEKSQGLHRIVWNGDDAHGNALYPGVYFIGLMTDTAWEVKKCFISR